MTFPDPSAFVVSDPRKNLLLAALPDMTWLRWLPQLEAIALPLGKVLRDAGRAGHYVYFPTTAIISLLCTTQDGGTSEIAVIGNEGVVGIGRIMGGGAAAGQAIVQSEGQAFRLRSKTLTDEISQSGPVLSQLLRYTQSLISQVAQCAACNRYHSIDQQLSRRLLLAMDRSPSHQLRMTHELAASLLGVRREGVTAAARKLQQAGVIRYARGDVVVLDRGGLERRTCECYAASRRASERASLNPARTATDRIAAISTSVKHCGQPIAACAR